MAQRSLPILLLLLSQVDVSRAEPELDRFDLSTDGAVDFEDVFVFQEQWGLATPPAVPTRYPYIQRTDESSFLIAWRTDLEIPTRAVYGTGPANLDREAGSSDPTRIHAAEIGNLSPETTYYYRVLDRDGSPLSRIESTRTFPPRGVSRPVRFTLMGDSGRPFFQDGGIVAGPDQLLVAFQQDIVAPDFFVHLGDLVYDSGERQRYDPLFFTPYRETLKRAPVFPCIGNHDVATENGQPYIDNFYPPENAPDSGERYYSFDYGNVHFTILDSNAFTSSSPDYDPACLFQCDWLEADLAAAADQKWKVVAFHHPPYTTGIHLFDRPNVPLIREQWTPLFEAYGVDVVFSGHDHDYQRSLPLRGGAPDLEQGVLYVVSGGGGNTLRPSISYAQCPAAFRNSAFRETTRYHLLKVTVDGDLLTMEAIDKEGVVFDTFHISKTAAADCVAPFQSR